MAEWLRRRTWNPLGFSRVGSNPANVVILTFSFVFNSIHLFSRWLMRETHLLTSQMKLSINVPTSTDARAKLFGCKVFQRTSTFSKWYKLYSSHCVCLAETKSYNNQNLSQLFMIKWSFFILMTNLKMNLVIFNVSILLLRYAFIHLVFFWEFSYRYRYIHILRIY